MWKHHNTFLNNQYIKEAIKRKVEKYLESEENKNKTYQNLLDTAQIVWREKFWVTNTHNYKRRAQMNDLTLYLKELEKQESPKL
jgi:BMFP domain-containing protein YqiC